MLSPCGDPDRPAAPCRGHSDAEMGNLMQVFQAWLKEPPERHRDLQRPIQGFGCLLNAMLLQIGRCPDQIRLELLVDLVDLCVAGAVQSAGVLPQQH